MAIVNVSLDTSTRQVYLTIGGVIVPVAECFVSKYVFDGEEFIEFSYTVEIVNSDGMKERRQFFLPSLGDIAANAKLDKNGFASKIVFDDQKAKKDIINLMTKQ